MQPLITSGTTRKHWIKQFVCCLLLLQRESSDISSIRYLEMPIGYVGFDVSSDHPALFQEEIKQIKETASILRQSLFGEV
jgi:hypothetical protein